MGYDFRLLALPEDLLELRERARVDPDSGAFSRLLELAEPYSFHLNIAGMGFCREQMARLGMLAEGDVEEPSPAEPEWDHSLYATVREHRRTNPDVWREFDEADRRYVSQRAIGPGVPRFKLSSNGDWIVLPDEVAGALAAYDSLTDGVRSELEADEVWAEWIAWLRRASSGFEVG